MAPGEGSNPPPPIQDREVEITEAHVEVERLAKNSVPGTELVSLSFAEISSLFLICRVANRLYPIYPRISYICSYGGLQEALRLNLVARGCDDHFITQAKSWIDKYEKAGKGKLSQEDGPFMQNFYLEHYDIRITGKKKSMEGHVGSSSSAASPVHYNYHLQKACQTALALYKVLELLWKAENLKPEIKHAHIEVQKLAHILEEDVPDSEQLPSSLAEITVILRVANEVQRTDRRVAYICCHSALDESLRLDNLSRGHGAHPFITLLARYNGNTPGGGPLEPSTDIPHLQSFYVNYYEQFINPWTDENMAHTLTTRAAIDSSQLTKACQTALVLYKVLEVISKREQLPQQIVEKNTTVKKLGQIYKPYNILPLDPLSATKAIMRFPQIQAVVTALSKVDNLEFPPEANDKKDMLDWLQAMFGFQRDNVSNQREHLILLLANVQRRKFPAEEQPELHDGVLDTVMFKLLENYTKWYKFLGLNDCEWYPKSNEQQGEPLTPEQNQEKQVRQQRKLLRIGLYLLIWGEAANIRFMPECICYIYHNMALELFGILNKELMQTKCGGEDEGFLNKVVIPIYKTIAQEAKIGNKKGDHSDWSNYDDLNEIFWNRSKKYNSKDWLETVNFFDGKLTVTDEFKVGKVNFDEIRSCLHLFRNFDTMWTFYVVCLEAMILIAWNKNEEPESDNLFHKDVIIFIIFITAAILNMAQRILELYLSGKARHSTKDDVKNIYSWKAIAAVIWVILMSLTYAYSLILFIVAIFFYLLPNMISAARFLSPFIQRHLRSSRGRTAKIVEFMMWRCQPHMYLGWGLHENLHSLCRYTSFWVFLLLAKFAFTFLGEIMPLVGPTKEIWKIHTSVYHLFPAISYTGLMISLWAPVILVYFMDTQLWYATFSTLVGGYIGFFLRLGEIQTLGTLRTRFQSLPNCFDERLFPEEKEKRESTEKELLELVEKPRFCQMWNTIISSFRKEDLISDREMELLLVPYWKKMNATQKKDSLKTEEKSDSPEIQEDANNREDLIEEKEEDPIRWPVFLVANKIQIALEMAKDGKGRETELRKILVSDIYMMSAVKECYASFKILLKTLVVGKEEVPIIDNIFSMVAAHIKNGTLIQKVNLCYLPDLYDQFVQLVDCLLQKKGWYNIVVILVKMLDVVTLDMMCEEFQSERESSPCKYFHNLQLLLAPQIEDWEKNIKRLYLLLTVKEAAMDVPSNLEARRRLMFFSNSLFMKMPKAPTISSMLSFSVLTPHFEEDVLFSKMALENPNDDGISILFYLQNIFPDEWRNFQERVNDSKKQLGATEKLEEERLWASYRGQTLTKTVRGMMYYREALERQAFFELAKGEDLIKGYKALKSPSEGAPESGSPLSWDDCQAYADLKFTYVVACQQYNKLKRSGKEQAKDILRLMTTYPSMRVAYIDEVEKIDKGTVEKIYYSTLVKAEPKSKPIDSPGSVQTLDQVIYRIKLPGNPKIGEGKPENQNHAIIFTRGEALQTIDMNQVRPYISARPSAVVHCESHYGDNTLSRQVELRIKKQDNYMEEAFKMRNLLEEFEDTHGGVRTPTILGLREHIFTGSVSSLAWFMSNQENSFVTLGQRVLASPLKIFDRLFHLTRGGVSKASKTINLSEDIFAGFSSTLREGDITHHEYIQVGKGRDVGFNQITQFEAKIAKGSGEQTLSRDLYRLGHQFDFFRMLSCYFTTVGFYVCSMLTVLSVYVFLYCRLYLALSGLEEEMWNNPAIRDTKALQATIASQSVVQIGFIMALPMIVVIGIERGFHNALFESVLMQLQLAPVFFTFQLGTKAHYYMRTLLHGGAEYIATGRGFVVVHVKFAENYRSYFHSHFVKAFELMILLLVYHIVGSTYMGVFTYILITFSIWFMVGSWLFAPFLFNPSGFEWHKIVNDWGDWVKWINEFNHGRTSVLAEKSWESWWEKEQENLRRSGTLGTCLKILLPLRFFIFQFGLIYYNIWIFVTSCVFLVMIIILILMFSPVLGEASPVAGEASPDSDETSPLLGETSTISGEASQRHDTSSQFSFRRNNVIMFLIFLAILIILPAFRLVKLKTIFLCTLPLIPSGWGLVLIAQAFKHKIQIPRLLSSVKTLAWGYDLLMGFILFTPVALLAWFPFVSEFQTRILFNQAFSRGLKISHVLGDQSSAKNKE